jgi:hypothetical protein
MSSSCKQLEDRNGEQKLRVTVVKLREIDHAKETKGLISAIKKYE